MLFCHFFFVSLYLIISLENKDISLETCDDVHAVACLLKLYLRELPEPVLSFRFYETFISIQSLYFSFLKLPKSIIIDFYCSSFA